MEHLHKDADSVPKLRGNTFFRCLSCMSNKLCTKLPGRHKTLGAQMKQEKTASDHNSSKWKEVRKVSSALNGDDDKWEEALDNLHLPEALPGQHFHLHFGFVQGSEYRLKQKNAPTVTSIDGKNSYCLVIVNRTTCYMWIY